MRTRLLLLAFSTLLAVRPALAAEPANETAQRVRSANEPKSASPLTTFDLDFHGGTPSELVAAIQKATGRPLNAIIPVEYAGWQLPPLKMTHVTAAELFQAMQLAHVNKAVDIGGNFQMTRVAAYFSTVAKPATDDSVWFFYVDGSLPPKVTKFYLLAPYLAAGLTVDDITTAIQTGWRMRGDSTSATLSFHQETKLLIANGEPPSLATIDAVLRALEPTLPGKALPPSPKAPAEEKKS